MRVTTSPQPLSRGLGTSRRARVWFGIGVVGALAAIFALDRATGAAPVQHLYYLPIIAAGLTGSLAGVATAAAAIAMYHLANPHLLTFAYGHWDVVQVTLFVIVGLATARMAEDRRRLHYLSMTDDLTGLSNLRFFEQQLVRLVRAARAGGSALSLLVLDLDRLKALNDVHGHLAGAEAVRTVGHVIARYVPPGAVACRYGGDEFVVALPRLSRDGALRIADDIRSAVRRASPVLAGVPFSEGTLSVSVGLASTAGEIDPEVKDATVAEALFRAADAALYRAKEGGRNQVSLAQSA